MEIIPIADEASEAARSGDTSPPIDSFDSGSRPLGVELLEDRVLLATDAAPSAAATPADVDAPPSLAAHVAQPHAPQEQASSAQLTPEGDAPAGGSKTSADADGDSVVVTGLIAQRDEPHAELVERTIERKENIESSVEEKVDRRFGQEKVSAAATIEPEDAQSPQDREAAKRLVGTADAQVDIDATSGGSAEEATASAVVSLMNEPNGALGARTNQVVDDLANKLVKETNVEQTVDVATPERVSSKIAAVSVTRSNDSGSASLHATAEDHASTVSASAEPNLDEVAAAFSAHLPRATSGGQDPVAR